MKRFQNGHQTLDLVTIHHRDLTNINDNIAIVRRVVNEKTKDFAVVHGVRFTDDNKGDWAFAYQYDLESLTEATQVFLKKIS